MPTSSVRPIVSTTTLMSPVNSTLVTKYRQILPAVSPVSLPVSNVPSPGGPLIMAGLQSQTLLESMMGHNVSVGGINTVQSVFLIPNLFQNEAMSSISYVTTTTSIRSRTISKTPSPVRKNRVLRQKLRNARSQNSRMRVKLFNQPDKEMTLWDIFKGNPNLHSLMKMQYDRHVNPARAAYSDFQESIALTLFYQGGRKGYR